MKKRVISLLLSAAMILGMLPAIEIPVAAANHENSTINSQQIVAPVYNNAIFDAIKGEHLSFDRYPGTGGASASIGPLFLNETYQGTIQKLGYNGGDFYNLITTTETRDRATEWDMYYSGISWWSSIEDNPDVKMRLGGNLINGATMSIYDGDTLQGTNSGTKNKTVTATKDVSIGGTIKTSGRITNPWVVLIDNNKPELVSVSGGLQSLTLTFDEILRWANGSASSSIGEYTITVKVANAKSGVEWGTITYQATEVNGSTMTFNRISDAPPAGNYQITAISGRTNAEKDENFEVFGIVQCYAYSYGQERRGSTWIHLMQSVNNPLKKIADIENMSPLSDLAGNALELPGKLDLRGYNIGFDNQAPTLEKVYLSGGMVSSACETDKDSWPADIDLSAVYAGTGDQFYINLQFSEELQHYTSQQMIKLNVMQGGSAVVLSNPTYTTATNAMGEACTLLRFGPFTVTSDMTMAPGYENSPIGVIDINAGSSSYYDLAGNRLSGGIPVLAQFIYLDATAPTVTAEQVGGKDESGAVSRTPTIKLTISDGIGSGSLGLEGQIGLSAAAETPVSYRMAITDSMIAPDDSAYIYTGTLGGDSVSWQTIALYNDTRYLHIKLLGAEGSITLEDLKIEYRISDWAGNIGVSAAASVEPGYAIDEAAPTVTAPQFTMHFDAVTASVTASWSASDYNEADGITTYYQWSDTEPADYSSGWIEAGEQSENFLWNCEEITFTETANITLWVYAVDASGNRSEMVSSACVVDVTKASSAFVLETDPQIPTGDPRILISTSSKTIDSVTQYPYVRATITFNDQTYIVILPPQDAPIYLFPITGTVYRVTMNGDTYESATALTEQAFNEILNAWYGEITVSFESAYYDLTPLAEGSPDGSYSGFEGNLTFRYAPALAGVHSVSLSDVTDSNGTTLDGTAESLFFNRTLSGITFTVSIENLLRSEWGLTDVDFKRSFVTLVRIDGDTPVTVATLPLSPSADQRITLPDIDYPTGAYQISATVTSRAGSEATETYGTVFVVDNEVPLNVGVWDAYITPGISLYGDFVPNATYFDENGDPILTIGQFGYIYDYSLYTINKTGDRLSGTYIESLTLNMSGKSETVRSDTFTTEVSGIYNFGFTISVDNETQVLGGYEIGGIQAIYIWNPAVHADREEGIMTADSSYTYRSADSLERETWVVDETTGIGSSTPNMTADGYYAMAEDIWLKPGSNIICYQVVMKNGLESPVYQLNITTTTATPTAQLAMDVIRAQIVAEEGQPTNIVQADVSLQNVFAANGTHQIYYITKDSTAIINGETWYYSATETLEQLKAGYYNSKYGLHVNESNIELNSSSGAPSTEYVFGNSYYEHYKVRSVDENTVVTIVNDGYEVYNTTISEDGDEYVTYKMDGYSAAGAFLIIDESGGTTLIFPQFAMEDMYGEATPTIEGYTPQYSLKDYLVSFVSGENGLSVMSQTHGRCEVYGTVINSQFADRSKSTITFIDSQTGEEVYRSSILSPQISNSIGYLGGSWEDGGAIKVRLASPVTTDLSLVGTSLPALTARMDVYDTHTNDYVTAYLMDYNGNTEYTCGISYKSAYPEVYYRDNGVYLYWGTYVRVDGETAFSPNITLPIFKNGSYTISFTDAWGNVFTDIPFEVTGFDGPEVTVDPVNRTAQGVTVTVQIPEGSNYDSVTVSADSESAMISGNGTGLVTVTLTENATLTIEWPGNSKTVTISNILPAEPTVIWSFGEDISQYSGGDVTAYVVDESGNWDLIDPLTGELPMITFTAGSATSYTFTSISNGELLGENVYYDLGSFTVTLPEGLVLSEVVIPEPPESADEKAPSVQIVPYAMQNSLAVSKAMTLRIEENLTYLEDGESVIGMPNPALAVYDGYDAYSDPYAFAETLGWASCFRFQIEVQDLSATRIIIKNGLYADAPTYHDESEAIENVALSGNTLDISGPAQFTIFVIDSAGNCVTIPMDLYNIGAAPVPTCSKTYTTVGEDSAIRVTLTAPDGGSSITITTVDGVAASEAVFTENGTYAIGYTYLYQGETVSGTLRVTVTEIDNEPPTLVKIEWSANKLKQVNQVVTATLTFNKDIARVQSTLAEVPDTVEVLISGNRVTIRYTDNTETLSLHFFSINGKRTNTPVELDSVTNIDRTAPEITASAPVLSHTGGYATITFTANETVSFREGNAVGTTFTRIVNANKTYTYSFTDAAGNVTTVDVTVTEIVDTPLSMQFNTAASDTGAVASPDELGQMQIGDTFYVKVNRAASVFFNRETVAVEANTWTALTVGDKSGGAIMAKDTFGNTVSAVFTDIRYPDITAPRIVLKKDTVYVSLKDLSSLEETLTANAEAVDDRSGAVTVTVHYEMPTAAGTYEVTYTAEDAAGNKAVIVGKLRVYRDDMPLVYINGEVVEQDAIYIAHADTELVLAVDMNGESYRVTWKKGIKTVAQMKTGATEIELTEDSVTLPFSGKSGYYTICITTQSHEQYRVVIYVK